MTVQEKVNQQPGNGKQALDTGSGTSSILENPTTRAAQVCPASKSRALHILAIDDHEEMLSILQALLEEAGHHVVKANSGPAGLALVEQQCPDVILLDIRMPQMDGLQVLQCLKQSLDTARIPVIILTGDHDLDLMEKGFQLGADDYLHKPFNIIELQVRIRHRARLKQATDAAQYFQELNRLKDDFLAVLSHELRTPLTAVIGFTELLLSEAAGPLNPQQLDFEKIVLQRASDLHRLIEDLLDFSLIRAGKRLINPHRVYVHDLVHAAMESARVQQPDRELDLEVRLPEPDVPVMADPPTIQRVLRILLDNAIKFTPDGGKITLEVKSTVEWVIIKINDTGIGIPADSLGVVFEGFRQLEQHATREHGGLGLGLALAKHLVELNRGRIWAESREGYGSTFTVVLPADGFEEI